MARAAFRPYDDEAKELALEICILIATHALPLAEILKLDERFPSSATFFRWKLECENLRERYLECKRSQIDVMMDNVNARLLDDSQDIIVQPDGKLTPNSVRVARDQLIYRGAAWQAARLSPKIYGDRMINENHVTHTVSAVTNDKISNILSLIEER